MISQKRRSGSFDFSRSLLLSVRCSDTMTTSQSEIDSKATWALVLSSLSFVIIIVFVIVWPFNEKFSKIDKRSVWRCVKWTRKKVKKTRNKLLPEKRKKGKVAEINVEVLEAGKHAEESHFYATISGNRKASTARRSHSLASNDSDFSTSDNAINDAGIVSVELHAYQSVALESYKQNSVLEEIDLHSARNSTYDSEKNVGQILDQTTGCCIYDEVEGNGRKSPR